jgi:hypothetical protein
MIGAASKASASQALPTCRTKTIGHRRADSVDLEISPATGWRRAATLSEN